MLLLNGKHVHTTRFPDNTSQVWNLDFPAFTTDDDITIITWDYTHEAEFFELAQLKALLERLNYRNIELEILYLPYARQDKEVSNNQTFALRTFAPLLNSLNFKKIVITDPHSTTALELVKNSAPCYPFDQVKAAVTECKSTMVCYPDAGAFQKYKELYPFVNRCYGDKVRNKLTGEIIHMNVVGNPRGRRVMIIDDICDGGATFIRIASELYKRDADRVDLFVTHGLFSRGVRVLHDAGIKRIFDKKAEHTVRSTQ